MANNSSYEKLRLKIPKQFRIPMVKLKDRVLSLPVMPKETSTDPNLFLQIIQDYALVFGPFSLIFTVERHKDGEYEHLSVSHMERYPNWDELMQLRAVFFKDDAEVFQVMPPCDEYVNVSSNCFHLWHKRGGMIITI